MQPTSETSNMKENFINEPGTRETSDIEGVKNKSTENNPATNKKKSVPKKLKEENSENQLNEEKKSAKKLAKKNIAAAEKDKETADKISTEKKIETKTEKVTKKKTTSTAAEKDLGIKKTVKKTATKKVISTTKIKLSFFLRFHTEFGQTLYITAQHKIFGDGDINKALPMQYWNEDFWTATIELNNSDIPVEGIVYNYVVKNENGDLNYDWGSDKNISKELFVSEETVILDAWNFSGFYENAFYTEPFQQVLLKNNFTAIEIVEPKTYTHIFKIKAPLIEKGQTVFIAGNMKELGDWGRKLPVLMYRKEEDDFFSVKLDLSNVNIPIAYKYGVYDLTEKKIVRFEDGNNRWLHNAFLKTTKTVVNDGFIVLPTTTWKGAGVAIPVFSLRSKESFGVGEFTDLKLLVDWAKKVGLKLVQVLPVNDTTATHTWMDSYPYSAISAFALHPMYLNLAQTAGEYFNILQDALLKEKERLNKLTDVDYEAVNKLKWEFIKQFYPLQKDALFASNEYKEFYERNKHWLIPYAAFCYFRDKYRTADFNAWPHNKTYNEEEINALLEPSSKAYDDLALYFFVQYHLYVQLKQATKYAHENGVIIKGDIPIGVYRYGADAWQHPGLFHMDIQAGAPPDDFAVTGQNWNFPTYNWEKMREDDFAWWKQRFEEMSYYFDAFRIDHILGFFRIWSIPYHSVEGIMGHFEPAIPVDVNEFYERGIWFDQQRYCRPYINEQILSDMFGDQQNHVKYTFLNYDGFGQYQMKPEFETQRQVENCFTWQEDNGHNKWLKKQLFHLISNVILFEAEGSKEKQFHFRFSMQETSSFKNLNAGTQYQLDQFYADYFFKRQDNLWMHQAMQKLPALKRATNMLVCGEDLGLVPASVPEVMRQTGILSLEIQRMPKDAKREFFHPADAPYLSVVTPSTHDMSTIRGWWEEDRTCTQHFFNNELGQWGEAPYLCDAWVNEAIVVQHLHSPAMWSIFLLQDILGCDKKIRRPNPHEERINVPANPRHYWKYRMHLNLEDLINANEFNEKFAADVKASGRA